MYRQRKVDSKLFRRREREPSWSPRVAAELKRTAKPRPKADDWYAVVDDIGEGTIKLEIARWPKLDRAGRLRFDDTYEQVYALGKLQGVIDRARERHKQPAADRPLRVGDAFWIRSAKRPRSTLTGSRFAGTILDITDAAREQAKIAMYGAVARKLKPTEARALRKAPAKRGPFERLFAKPRERRKPRIPGATAEPEV